MRHGSMSTTLLVAAIFATVLGVMIVCCVRR